MMTLLDSYIIMSILKMRKWRLTALQEFSQGHICTVQVVWTLQKEQERLSGTLESSSHSHHSVASRHSLWLPLPFQPDPGQKDVILLASSEVQTSAEPIFWKQSTYFVSSSLRMVKYAFAQKGYLYKKNVAAFSTWQKPIYVESITSNCAPCLGTEGLEGSYIKICCRDFWPHDPLSPRSSRPIKLGTSLYLIP